MSWSDAERNPSADPTPLDRASFYVEELKYGVGPRRLEQAKSGEIAAEFESLLRDAGVTSMTGEELARAMVYYGRSLANTFRTPRTIALSMFCDGLMHGIALAAGLTAEPRKDD
jgi:hypothetical protein